ncbi:50S ribosomal protein L3 [bacterium]|nr:50S ribosomal protein L3 [bacterium]
MKFILGKKLEMSQVFDEKNNVLPVTKVLVTPSVITQIKTLEKDGYNAVQISFGNKKKLNKAQKGHFKDLGDFAFSKEFRLKDISNYNIGDKVSLDSFEEGINIDVVGTSKGRGFAGTVKRHGFHGQLASHGTKDQLRMPGTIGSTGPAHVFKGTRMAGHMGNQRVTVKNLRVVKIDKENNILYIKGAVPGSRGSLLIIKENN